MRNPIRRTFFHYALALPRGAADSQSEFTIEEADRALDLGKRTR